MKTSIAIALVLTVAYAVVIGFSNSGAETAAQGYWRKNRNVIAGYDASRPKPVVFAGSSLTAAVRFHGFEGCIYNLGLIGESALTGLDVIAAGSSLPRKVFVEVNFPERESNTALIHSAQSYLARHFPDFVYLTPVSYLAQSAGGLLQRLRGAPADATAGVGRTAPAAAREAELTIQQAIFKSGVADAILDNKLTEFALKIAKLREKGVVVALIELPIHPDLENTPRARQIRESFQRTFPSLAFVRSDMLAEGLKINTADGLHLTDADSRGVLRNLSGELHEACAN